MICNDHKCWYLHPLYKLMMTLMRFYLSELQMLMSNSGQYAMGASFQKIGDEKSTQNIKIMDANRGANLRIKTSSIMLVSSMLRHKKNK